MKKGLAMLLTLTLMLGTLTLAAERADLEGCRQGARAER